MRKSSVTSIESQKLIPYGLNPGDVQGLTGLEYDRGEWVCREGGDLPCLFLVLSGKAKVICSLEDGRSLLLAFYFGGIIGDLELMAGSEKAHNSVQALTDFRCIGIPVLPNRRMLLSNQVFLNRIGTSLAQKLMRCSKNSAHNVLYPLQVRLCSYILIAGKKGLFSENLTETAELLGTSYRHLLRELSRLSQEGLLKKEEHAWTVANRKELLQRSRDYYYASVEREFPD